MDRTTDTETQTHMGTHTSARSHTQLPNGISIFVGDWLCDVCMCVCIIPLFLQLKKNCKPISDKLFANWSRKEKKRKPTSSTEPNEKKEEKKSMPKLVGIRFKVLI